MYDVYASVVENDQVVTVGTCSFSGLFEISFQVLDNLLAKWKNGSTFFPLLPIECHTGGDEDGVRESSRASWVIAYRNEPVQSINSFSSIDPISVSQVSSIHHMNN